MNKQNIIIVDDIPENIRILHHLLRNEGYLIKVANNGQRALDLVKDEKPDLILMDIMMPGMDGYQACQQLKDESSTESIPVIFITAKDDNDSIVHAFNMGAVDYITKPFNHDEVLSRVRVHLENQSLLVQVLHQQQQLQMMNDKLQEAYTEIRASFADERMENRHYEVVYEDYVPKPFLSILGRDSILDVKRGDCIEKEMTVLFSDIRGFTTLLETLSPQDAFQFINEYLLSMEKPIRDHHGFIDKFIGDAIMALFDCSPDNAVKAGLAMLSALNDYNTNRQEPIKIGIGIHTDKLMLGTVGGLYRMDTTVIGDGVNIAARLESLSKNFGTLLISEATYQQLSSDFFSRKVANVCPKGKKCPVMIYEVMDHEDKTIRQQKMQYASLFESVLNSIQLEDFDAAVMQLDEYIKQVPGDQAAIYYLGMINEMENL